VSLHFPSVSVPESQLFPIVIKPAERNNVYLDRSGGRLSPRDTILWWQRHLFSSPSNFWIKEKRDFQLRSWENSVGFTYFVDNFTGHLDINESFWLSGIGFRCLSYFLLLHNTHHICANCGTWTAQSDTGLVPVLLLITRYLISI
jgi:hypothetical protein